MLAPDLPARDHGANCLFCAGGVLQLDSGRSHLHAIGGIGSYTNEPIDIIC